MRQRERKRIGEWERRLTNKNQKDLRPPSSSPKYPTQNQEKFLTLRLHKNLVFPRLFFWVLAHFLFISSVRHTFHHPLLPLHIETNQNRNRREKNGARMLYSSVNIATQRKNIQLSLSLIPAPPNGYIHLSSSIPSSVANPTEVIMTLAAIFTLLKAFIRRGSVARGYIG